jgi:hypothetical protein
MDDCLLNRCRVDEAKMRASARFTTRTQRYLDLLIAALVLIAGFYNVLRLLKTESSGFSTIIGTVVLFGLGIFLLRDAFTAADRAVRLSLERRRQQGTPEDLEITLRFGPSEIEKENSFTRKPDSFPYDQIVSILRSGDAFQMLVKTNVVYILDPDRFEHGTEADFWRLMNEKCPKAVPKKRRT